MLRRTENPARRALIAVVFGILAAGLPRPGACDTYVRDEMNVLHADTIAAIQARNADLIARTGACIDVITVATAGDDRHQFVINSVQAFGNHCTMGASILIEQTGHEMIVFEDPTAGFKESWQAITQELGDGLATGDMNGPVLHAVNAIADGIIEHPAPTPKPIVYASPPPPPSALDNARGLIAANWQTTGGRFAIIGACLLALFLIASFLGLGRARRS